MNFIVIMVINVLMVSGCMETFYTPGNRIKIAIKKHHTVESLINLGDSKQNVLRILQPTQEILTPDLSKVPDRYTKQGVLVDIRYMRSGWYPDGLKTDDEFTPYVFNDNKLVGVGWRVLGVGSLINQASPTTIVDMVDVVY
jgi:hypothetical protein